MPSEDRLPYQSGQQDEALVPSLDADPEGLEALKNLDERRKRARRNNIIKIVVICVVAVVLVAIWLINNLLASRAAVEAIEPEVAVVTRTDLTSSVQATGSLKPSSQVVVSPEVSGTVQEVMVVEGQHVEAGDVLLTIKSADVEKDLASAEQALQRAQRNLGNANAGLSSDWDDYNRAIDEYNAAVENANAGKGEDPGAFDHSVYLSTIKADEEGVQSAQDAVEDAQRTYNIALEQANKRTVRSPIAGTVLDLKATAGAAVGGDLSSGGSLMQIADLSKLGVDIEVNEIDIANVKIDQRAAITFSALPGLELEGGVTSVASVASTSSNEGATTSGGVVTFKVTVAIDQPDDRLKPGMSATVNVRTKEVPDVLVIPSAAVIEDGSDTFVLVVEDEKASNLEQRAVVLGDRSGTQVAVTSGLEEGELVLVSTGADGSSSSSKSSSSAAV